jgi:hypothetical protein
MSDLFVSLTSPYRVYLSQPLTQSYNKPHSDQSVSENGPQAMSLSYLVRDLNSEPIAGTWLHLLDIAPTDPGTVEPTLNFSL